MSEILCDSDFLTGGPAVCVSKRRALVPEAAAGRDGPDGGLVSTDRAGPAGERPV